MKRSLAFLLTVLCGCGARSGLLDAILGHDAGTDTAPACSRDDDCAPTGDPCMRAFCGAGGRCARGPVAFGSPTVYPTSSVLGHLASDGDGAVAVTVEPIDRTRSRLGLLRIGLAGPLGNAIPVAEVSGDRAYDVDALATARGILVAGHDNGTLAVRRIERDGRVSEVARFAQPGNFAHLSPAGTGAVITADRQSGCAMAWLDASGAAVRPGFDDDPAACPASMVMSVGLPPFRRAVSATAQGAWFLALTSDGQLHRTEGRPGQVTTTVSRFAHAMSMGPLFNRSIVAAADGDRVGALWVRTDTAPPGMLSVRAGVFDAAMRPVSAERAEEANGSVYPPTMDATWCHDRFVGLWWESRGGALLQLQRNGEPLAGVLKFGGPVATVPMRVMCIPGGAVAAAAGTVAVFRCGS